MLKVVGGTTWVFINNGNGMLEHFTTQYTFDSMLLSILNDVMDGVYYNMATI